MCYSYNMIYRVLPAISVILFFFIVLFLYTKLAGPIPFSVNSVSTTKSDTYNVSGEGKVSISPDIAVLSIGVTANGNTVTEAQNQINSKINQVSEAIKALGVDSKDIQTNSYSVNPNYDFNSGTQRITGYNATTNLSIRVKKLDNINAVIDTSTQNGANQVNGLSFDVEDRTEAENEARQKAIEDAKKKAQQAAKIAGFKLGNLVNYQENFSGNGPIPLPARAENLAADKTTTQVEPGQTDIVISVTLSFEIR
jgi:uncharacterized protein